MELPDWSYLLIGTIFFTIAIYAISDFIVELIDPRFKWLAAIIMVVLAALLIVSLGFTVKEINEIPYNPVALGMGI